MSTNTKPAVGVDVRTVLNAFLMRRELFQSMLDRGIRDIDHECGYLDSIEIKDYVQMYERVGIARRIVRCLPEESWSDDPDVYETSDSDETPFELAWKNLIRELPVFHYLRRIDEMSGIGTYGVLLLGFDDGLELNQQVPAGEHKLLYMRAFDESVLQIQERDTNPSSPRFNMPVMYTVDFKDPSDSQGGGNVLSSRRVHWTRVIHVADERTTSEVFGTPRMKAVFNYLLDIRKILGGSGEMFWKGGFPGMSFELHPDAQLSNLELDKTAIREEFERYSEGLQRYLALEGLQAKTLAPQVSDPSAHINANLQAIAITLSIPFRVLFGSEQAQLASGQDARNWAKRIRQRQEKYVSLMIVRPFVDRLIAFGVLPAPIENYVIEWPDLLSPSDDDKATVALKVTQAMAAYVSGGVEQVMPFPIYMQEVLGFPQDLVDAITEEMEEQLRREEQTAQDVPQDTEIEGDANSGEA